MTAQPSGQPSEQPPRWRATRGPFMVSDGGAHPAAPATPAPPTAYYPGGPHGGYFPGGPHGPGGNPPSGGHSGSDEVQVLVVAPPEKPVGYYIAAFALALLGLWVLLVAYSTRSSGGGPVLSVLAGLVLVGIAAHLAFNPISRKKPDAKAEENARTITLVMMLGGGALSLLMLTERNAVLVLPAVLAGGTLFVFSFVNLLKPKE
jgi:hypothetical protein